MEINFYKTFLEVFFLLFRSHLTKNSNVTFSQKFWAVSNKMSQDLLKKLPSTIQGTLLGSFWDLKILLHGGTFLLAIQKIIRMYNDLRQGSEIYAYICLNRECTNEWICAIAVSWVDRIGQGQASTFHCRLQPLLRHSTIFFIHKLEMRYFQTGHFFTPVTEVLEA